MSYMTYTAYSIIKSKEVKPKRVAIIGGGAGGVSAAIALRQRGSSAQITIYTREKVPPYYRPSLTKKLFDDIKDNEYFLHPESFYAQRKIKIETACEIRKIDRELKTLIKADGNSAPYDKLVIAAGARCLVPPIPGVNLPNVFALREQDDFARLKALLLEGKKNIIIIGGGLLGLETACSLAHFGHEVTVMEACPVILPRQTDPETAEILERLIKNSGVDFRTNASVGEILSDKNGRAKAVKTGDGKLYACDLIIISIGIRPNTDLASDAGLNVDKAVVVDEFMRSSDPDIYAAGDCAIFAGRNDGLWKTALEQGKIAGANIAGENKAYQPKALSAALHAFGIALFTVGDISQGQENCRRFSSKDEAKNIYRNFYFKDDKLAGGILLGDVSQSSLLNSVVNENISVEKARELKLLS
jgi:NAD(P)H-nitrite reductase large subunit